MSAKKSKRRSKRLDCKKRTPSLAQVHDSFFKLSLKDKEIAQEVLENYLPANIKPLCDFKTLRLESSSFITEELKQKFNDILYSVETKKGRGYVYFLLEAQSSSDKFIALRMINYALLAIMEALDKKKHEKPPFVVPLLFYFDKKPHPKSIPLNWLDSFSDPKLARQLFTEDVTLIDMATIDDATLRKYPKSGLMFYLEKHIRYRDLMRIESDLDYYLSNYTYSLQYLNSTLIYVYVHGKIDQPEEFLQHLQIKFPQYQEVQMTIAEHLRQEGKKAGLMEGEQQGLHKAAIAIAKNMLAKGADIEFIQSTTNLSEEEIKKLIH